MVELLAIRAFGHLAGLSRKALLQYEELGILLPARVDSHSGYRWYALTQLPQARRIGRLRKLGLPLARIREIVAHPDDQHVLAACWHEQERVFAAQRRLAEFLINQLPGKKADMHGLVDRLALPRDWTTADLSASLEREIGRSVVFRMRCKLHSPMTGSHTPSANHRKLSRSQSWKLTVSSLRCTLRYARLRANELCDRRLCGPEGVLVDTAAVTALPIATAAALLRGGTRFDDSPASQQFGLRRFVREQTRPI